MVFSWEEWGGGWGRGQFSYFCNYWGGTMGGEGGPGGNNKTPLGHTAESQVTGSRLIAQSPCQGPQRCLLPGFVGVPSVVCGLRMSLARGWQLTWGALPWQEKTAAHTATPQISSLLRWTGEQGDLGPRLGQRGEGRQGY